MMHGQNSMNNLFNSVQCSSTVCSVCVLICSVPFAPRPDVYAFLPPCHRCLNAPFPNQLYALHVLHVLLCSQAHALPPVLYINDTVRGLTQLEWQGRV